LISWIYHLRDTIYQLSSLGEYHCHLLIRVLRVA